MKEDKPELAWNLKDYETRGEEAPRRIELSPHSTEGQLMSDAEIEVYIAESCAVLSQMAERKSGRFQSVQNAFFADLRYLVKLGRLSEDDYTEITNPDNFHF